MNPDQLDRSFHEHDHSAPQRPPVAASAADPALDALQAHVAEATLLAMNLRLEGDALARGDQPDPFEQRDLFRRRADFVESLLALIRAALADRITEADARDIIGWSEHADAVLALGPTEQALVARLGGIKDPAVES